MIWVDSCPAEERQESLNQATTQLLKAVLSGQGDQRQQAMLAQQQTIWLSPGAVGCRLRRSNGELRQARQLVQEMRPDALLQQAGQAPAGQQPLTGAVVRSVGHGRTASLAAGFAWR